MRTRPLTEVGLRDLKSLLAEETEHWGSELLWDYGDVSSAVASGLERKSLTGRVLQDGPRAVAYCYYMMDTGRAIVGSLFATAGLRNQGIEEGLLDAVLSEAMAHPGNDRVECQTLFSTAPGAGARFVRAGFRSRARHYLVRPLTGPLAAVPASTFHVRPLRRDDLGTAADLIYLSHRGSLDAALNMTYATPALCRAFVETLVLRSGCGRFDGDASLVAEDGKGMRGVVLASQLSGCNGHVCQVSVAPEVQGSGLGSFLVSGALDAFRRAGLTTASLSVTVENVRAFHLYERLGFRLRKEFAAYAWVRPPARIDLPA